MPSSIQGKKLVIFDLDGTLTPSKQGMTPSMAQAFQALMQKTKVAVISGGGYPQFQSQFLRSLPASVEGLNDLYLLPTSGTRLYMWQGDWKEAYREDLTSEEKKLVMEAFRVALATSGYTQPTNTYGEIIEDRGSQITFSGLGQAAPLEAKNAWDPTREKREKIATALREKLQSFDVRIGGSTSIDVTRRGINKAYGIHKLEQNLNIPVADMVFVGDALFYGGNDYPAKATGVDCIQVKGPEETEALIKGWI